ncbi:glycosyltransferase [Oceanobacillus chungangensis]|uniref:Glycosyl transferase family 1 domain-containing protein n=1 Tax=Oceanobacillus chungangensis TaxID=1229152 RepID=A0A3D8PYL5_9BACI|nr:glycosyltransferase [Oceanobacillus chungangensis]RDW20411.1 hypothetical protein CWR45_04015 [Oceanobacillus chungangensis]
MKKKIIIITQYMHTGGVEKSLLTLLDEINYEKYEIDLLLFDHSGILFTNIPQNVNILPPLFETYSTPLSNAVPKLIKQGSIRLLIGKVLASGLGKFSRGMGTGIRWSVYRHTLRNMQKHYDIAISYIDFFCNYYITEKVKADKKIVFNHMDYAYAQKDGWPCIKLDRKSFIKSDYIISVSESARKSLESYFPESKSKMHVIKNRVSQEIIRKMAKSQDVYKEYATGFKICTISRLVEEKGVWLALESCYMLVSQGYNVQWILVGNGPLRSELEKRAIDLGLEDKFILVGEKSNPYPYIAGCDVYVQPSKTEAHCIAVEEAIAIRRPIIVTDIPSFNEQITNDETGIIVPLSVEGIYEGIKKLYYSKELRQKLSKRLTLLEDRNKQAIKKFTQLIES